MAPETQFRGNWVNRKNANAKILSRVCVRNGLILSDLALRKITLRSGILNPPAHLRLSETPRSKL
jgi:hypothetical protein